MATIRELRARFTASAQGFRESVQGINQDMERVGDAGEQASDKMTKGFTTLKNTLVGFAGAYLGFQAISGAVGGVLTVTDQYQTALNGLGAQTGATSDEMSELSGSLKNIYADNYGADFQDIADSMALVKQNTGQTGKALEDTTKQALVLRDTFQYDIAQSTGTADTMMKQFGMTSEQAFNLIAQGRQEGLDKGGDWLDSLNEYSVYFKTLGYDAEGMWDVYNAGIDAGVMNTDVIGDTIKEFGIIAKDGSKSTSEAFKGLGLDADKMSQAIAKGGPSAQKAMQQTFQALGKIADPVERNSLGVSLFGTKFEDLEQKAVIALGNVQQKADMSADTMKKIDAVKYNNIGSAFEGLKRQIIVGLLDPIQGHVMPMINTFVNFMKTNMPMIKNAIVGAFSGIMSAVEYLQPTFFNLFTILKNVGAVVIPILVMAIKGILAVVLPVVSGITSLIAKFTEWGAFGPIIVGLATAIGTYVAITKAGVMWTKIVATATRLWALAQAGLNIVMSMNPIGLVIALIVGLVAGLIYAYKHSETFRNVLQSAWSGIKTVVSAVINWFMVTIPQWIAGLVAWFTGMGSSISNIWSSMINAIVTFFTGLWTKITSIATSIWTGLVGIWNSIVSTVSAVVSSFVSMVVGFITNMVTNIMNFFSPITTFFVNTWNNIKLLVLGIIGAFLNLITGNMEGFKISLLAIWTAIKNQVINTITMLKDMGIKIFTAWKNGVMIIINGLKTLAIASWNGLKSGTMTIINGLKTGFMAVVNGIKTGAINSWNALKTGAINSVNALKTGAINSINALKNGAINSVNAIKNGIVNGFNNAKSMAVNTFNAMKSGISNAINGVIGFVTNMKSRITSTISGINLRQMGVNVIKGFINGIKSMVGAVGTAIKSVAKGVTDKIKGALGIHSPSRVFMEIGQYTGEGLGIGIQKMQSFVSDATQTLADASFGTINSAELNPITATVQGTPGQGGQDTGTNYNAPLMSIENYYQNDQTDVRSISSGLYNLQRNSDRKKGK